MKIQLALDLLDEEQALNMVKMVGDNVDIIEIGTSLLKLAGVQIIEKIRSITPNKPIFVDMKIIDGPEREATLMANVKADYYSMLAVATDTAITKVLNIAQKHHAQVVFDMQSVTNYQERSLQLKNLGAQMICVHKNSDCGDSLDEAFKEFIDIKAITQLPIALAGGINLTTLPEIKTQLKPEVVIIGGTILKAEDPIATTKALRIIADS